MDLFKNFTVVIHKNGGVALDTTKIATWMRVQNCITSGRQNPPVTNAGTSRAASGCVHMMGAQGPLYVARYSSSTSLSISRPAPFVAAATVPVLDTDSSKRVCKDEPGGQVCARPKMGHFERRSRRDTFVSDTNWQSPPLFSIVCGEAEAALLSKAATFAVLCLRHKSRSCSVR